MAFDPVSAALEVGSKVIDRLWPDPQKAEEAKVKLAEMSQNWELAKLTANTELAKAQIALNTAEVQSGAWLGKWRGALGWGLALSAIYQFMAHPFLVAILLAFNNNFPVDKLPKLDWKQLGSVLMGMLGLGG
jgi:hypothetical protein